MQINYVLQYQLCIYQLQKKAMDSKNLAILGTGFLAGAICSGIAYNILAKNKSQQPHKALHKQDPQQINKSQVQPCQFQSDPQYKQLKQQQLARIIKFFGQEKFHRLQNSFVIVFGVGGVGSHVVNMLARSGVKRIRIIDFDTVSISSLNRHSFAVRQDVGTSKVDCLKKYIHKIFPHIVMQCVNVYVTVDNAKKLLINNYQQMTQVLNNKDTKSGDIDLNSPEFGNKPDYVVDCIDNLDAKVQLISICVENSMKLIVSGGAGMKADPTKLQIRDISDCKYDKLIMRIKRQLTKKSIKSGVKVVFSYQQSEKQLLPLTQNQEENPQAYKVFDNYRIRIIPVLGTMPAIIGMSIASYVLCELANQKYQPFQTDYVKSSSISKLYNQLLYQMKRTGRNPNYLKIDIEEASILAKKVYNWKCVINPEKKGDRLAVWDKTKDGTIDNLALMGKQAYEKHIKLAKLGDAGYSKEIQDRFQQKAKYAKHLWDSGYMMFI